MLHDITHTTWILNGLTQRYLFFVNVKSDVGCPGHKVIMWPMDPGCSAFQFHHHNTNSLGLLLNERESTEVAYWLIFFHLKEANCFFWYVSSKGHMMGTKTTYTIKLYFIFMFIFLSLHKVLWWQNPSFYHLGDVRE